MRTFKIHSPKKLLSNMQYSVMSYSPHAVYYIPMTYFVTGSLYLLMSFTFFAHTPAPPQATTGQFSISMSLV